VRPTCTQETKSRAFTLLRIFPLYHHRQSNPIPAHQQMRGRRQDNVRSIVLDLYQVSSALFNGTGVSSVNLTTCDGAARFPSMREFVEAELRGWLPVMGVALPEPQIDRILAEPETILARYVTADGLAFDISAHLATCRRP
jgi:hypothetical protein